MLKAFTGKEKQGARRRPPPPVELVARSSNAEITPASLNTDAAALIVRADMAMKAGGLKRASEICDDLVRIGDESGRPEGAGTALVIKGLLLQVLDQKDAALAAFKDAIALDCKASLGNPASFAAAAPSLDNVPFVATALFGRAMLLALGGKDAEAHADLDEIARRFGADAVEIMIELMTPFYESGRSVEPDESNGTVENPKETAYSPSVEHPPDIGGATEEWVTARVEKRRWEALKKEVAGGDASPAARALVEGGMVACGRELAGRDAAPVAEPATHPRDLSKPQVVAVIEDSTLGRLHRRYTELVASVELPKEGFKTLDQAKAAGRLASTFDNLQARRKKVGLEPLPSDARVTEARRLKSLFYYHQAPRSGRSQRAATLG